VIWTTLSITRIQCSVVNSTKREWPSLPYLGTFLDVESAKKLTNEKGLCGQSPWFGLSRASINDTTRTVLVEWRSFTARIENPSPQGKWKVKVHHTERGIITRIRLYLTSPQINTSPTISSKFSFFHVADPPRMDVEPSPSLSLSHSKGGKKIYWTMRNMTLLKNCTDTNKDFILTYLYNFFF
jgi:hypothetical protein